MTNKEILEKVIEKAQRNGFIFDLLPNKHAGCDHRFSRLDENIKVKILSDEYINCKNLINLQVDNLTATWVGLKDVIFSHDFAKAFFGEKPYNTSEIIGEKSALDYTGHSSYIYKKIPKWAYHLQQMILEEEPLKYLEKFL